MIIRHARDGEKHTQGCIRENCDRRAHNYACTHDQDNQDYDDNGRRARRISRGVKRRAAASTPVARAESRHRELSQRAQYCIPAVAGAGKSTTLLQCAAANPTKQVFLLTYNKRLELDLKERASALNIEFWRTTCVTQNHLDTQLRVAYYHDAATFLPLRTRLMPRKSMAASV